MGLLIDTMRKEMADPLFYTFEMPRELARQLLIWKCAHGWDPFPMCKWQMRHSRLACRYMYTHGYNISIPHLVDKIASPLVKKAMEHRAYKTLDSWPTPADYTHALQHSEHMCRVLPLLRMCSQPVPIGGLDLQICVCMQPEADHCPAVLLACMQQASVFDFLPAPVQLCPS